MDGAQEAPGVWLLCGRQWGLTVALGQEEARRINTEGCPRRQTAWEGGGQGLRVMPDTRRGGGGVGEPTGLPVRRSQELQSWLRNSSSDVTDC